MAEREKYEKIRLITMSLHSSRWGEGVPLDTPTQFYRVVPKNALQLQRQKGECPGKHLSSYTFVDVVVAAVVIVILIVVARKQQQQQQQH